MMKQVLTILTLVLVGMIAMTPGTAYAEPSTAPIIVNFDETEPG